MMKERETNATEEREQDGSWSLDKDDTDNQSYGIGGEDEPCEVTDAVNKLTQDETRGVHRWKVLTLLTILITALVVSTCTYMFLDQQEEEDFTMSFQLFSNAISDSVDFHVKELFESIRDASELITEEAYRDNSTFPFITLSLFEVVASQARGTSGIETLYWCPLVQRDQEAQWNTYSVQHQDWLNASRTMDLIQTNQTWEQAGYDNHTIIPYVWEFNTTTMSYDPSKGTSVLQPIWQISPPPFNSLIINYDLSSYMNIDPIEAATATLRHGLLDRVADASAYKGLFQSVESHESYHESLVDTDRSSPNYTAYQQPHTLLVEPIYKDLFNPTNAPIVGHVFALMTWDRYVVDLLPDGVSGITLVVRNTCNQSFTYNLDGNHAYYKGEGDFHDVNYNSDEVVIKFYSYNDEEEALKVPGHCLYAFYVYPTIEFESQYKTQLPTAMTIVVASTFIFLVGVFFMYDLFVYRRNRKMQNAVVKSNQLVSSMFPSNVRERLFAEGDDDEKKSTAANKNGKNRLKSYLATGGVDEGDEDNEDDDDFYKTNPIADLFPEATVLFADIAGFTAWSSTREPTQVFILLETIYKAFDEIAKSRRVFKVETVGDCYVAVTGLPDPRKDHAVAMARFAVDSMHRMHGLTKKLEVRLGPDTTDLDMRFGLHSGPVTAGVLRGERSRFQLFGDTMNTASRMESNGLPGKIHISQETADLLIAAGKSHWIYPREDKIIAKGKGELQTYWLYTTSSSNQATSEKDQEENKSGDIELSAEHDVVEQVKARDEKTSRLVQWNVEVLMSLLKKVVAQRAPESKPQDVNFTPRSSTTVLEEVVEIISLPHFNAERQPILGDTDDLNLGTAVEDQLKEYVSSIAAMYRDNPFHNFEHASHVTMSVVKLLSRIVTPDVDAVNSDMESTLHYYTYGITSDPLTQFACVFSALIHDVDHSGIPNTQLVVENPALASFYKNKSVAEQNSVDLSWDLLQDDSFSALRGAIYHTKDEMKRFRQLVVNSVMATDIMDAGLKALRNNRWDKAFAGNDAEESSKDAIDRKATIVIEHLIQASDVAHTMQHWHIYRKWNQRLFEEMYSAYIQGRSINNPADTWYKGEIGFFDFYIIPLGKKLKECGVFGVSSDEYLNYAEKNRKEWEQRGLELVAVMLEDAQKKYKPKPTAPILI